MAGSRTNTCASLELQRAFGLRREEAMKFQPSYADQKNHVRLKASWTKGGKPRSIPVRTDAQREVLDRARSLAGFGSLIPPHRSYVMEWSAPPGFGFDEPK